MVAWNKGLTKETDARVAQSAKTLKEGYASGRVIPHSLLKGKKQSAEFIAKRFVGIHKYYETHSSANKGLKIPKDSEHYKKLSKRFFKKGNKLYAGKQHTEEWKVNALQWLKESRTHGKTKLESRLEVIINKACPNQYKYSGDGSIRFYGYAPDFINVNGKKKVIELFGDYWHIEKIDSWKRSELGRIMLFNSFGFDTLIIWEHDMNIMSENELIELIKNFDKRKRR